ncbi:class II aldolase/adducin family protein [Martelella soudanensis]|uniref:class II aldolase/adducin family protein n=1 Tax=Martelella sp. NC18 TaxID=2740297 RepID=UPI002113871B|nr:class II aldolase/adducin family protein [Martelella sp. NC18]
MTAVSEPSDERRVRMAARALGRHGLVHAYGHCSARLDESHFLVCAPVPMGQMPREATGSVVPIDGPLPDGVLGEVRIHREIYRRRSDVGGVVRSMPPNLMALSTLRLTPKMRHGFGSYFYPASRSGTIHN